MKATEMINQLQELINEYGDCAVANLEKLKEFDSQFLIDDEIINKIKEIVDITKEDIQLIEDYLLTINQYDLY